jgi:asparagine synthetase B (glutamine-hydrolysing)
MSNYQNIWSDAYVEITDTIHEHRWNAVPKPSTVRSFDSVVDEIHNLLCAKFNWLAMNYDIVRVFYSGGIDTLTCISYLRALHVPFELVNAEHFDYDKFTVINDSEIRSYWGYNQIHHYRRPTVFVTGACGDEYFLRGPATANIMLMHLGKTMQQVLAPEHYHYLYFQGLEKSAIYARQQQDEQIQEAIQSKQTTADYILRMCINDHQHWHLGHTITFTPFKDIQFLQLTLELDDQNIIHAIVDASIQKALIQKNEPELLNYLAKNKNQDRSGIYRLSEYLNI